MTDVGSEIDRATADRPREDAESTSEIQALRAALAARDRFIALVGHELRNSVAPMLLLADQFAALASEPRPASIAAPRAAMLIRNLNRFIATVERVAEVADLRRGKLHLETAEVDLVEIVEEVRREAEREAEASNAELVIDGSGPVIGRWDRSRIKRIAAALVSNAIRHAGGRVELSVRERDGDGELVVRDHGPGIAPALLPRLFDQLDHDRGGSGFGIGLWLVKALCTAMQGSVTANNVASGGAAFCVVLPRG